ncbi:MAG: YbaB/EbfC family nucleoid-associated protein [Clostridia bacterium]|nr:YbaB/EbfC family nucleoid-associated protein [Clostridia bacterium]
MKGFGGFGGGNNMQALMRQAQKMQEDAMRAQKEVEESVVEGSASGGMVTVKLSGAKNLLEVKINPAVVDPDDVEMLEDLIVAAVNDASGKADDLKAQKLGAFGGMM